jgi:hypothetical protein
MDADSEIEPMECDEMQANETFDLEFKTHWRLATEQAVLCASRHRLSVHD